MNAMKIVPLLLGSLLVIGMAFHATGCTGGSKYDYYYLDVVNAGRETAEIEVSLSPIKMVVEPGKAKTFTIDQQSATLDKTVRDFTIRMGGKTEKIEGRVDYLGHTILDVTGRAGVVAADYGAFYRGKDVVLPEGRREIEIVKIYPADHPRIFPAQVFDKDKAQFDLFIHLGVGEPLPDSIKTSRGTQIPTFVRLVMVPADKLGNKDTVLSYLGEHR